MRRVLVGYITFPVRAKVAVSKITMSLDTITMRPAKNAKASKQIAIQESKAAR